LGRTVGWNEKTTFCHQTALSTRKKNFFFFPIMSKSSPHKPLPALLKHRSFFEYIPPGKKRQTKNLMTEKNVFDASTLSEQIFLTMGLPRKIGIRSQYNLSFHQIARIIKVNSAEKARELYLQGQKRINGTAKSPGRGPELTKSQEDQVIQYIIDNQNAKSPLAPIELLAWVNVTFDKNLSHTWPNKFVERNSERLFLVNAVPLEAERANVGLDQLKDYEKKATEALKKYDGRMVCNWDQTASETSKHLKKHVIVAGKAGKPPGDVY